MATTRVSDKELQQTVNCVARHSGNRSAAGIELGLNRRTVGDRIAEAERRGIVPSKNIENMENIDHVKLKLKRTEAALSQARESSFDERAVRELIVKLANDVSATTMPDWVISADQAAEHSPGVPTLFASDWHYGEVVDPTQIGGVNKYNMTIANDRARTLIERAIDLLNNHMVNPNYPGIVFALGGDMISGDIHEELMATNEVEIMPTVVELFGILTWCISTLADEFGRVFCPCVSGNHGRNTARIRAKGRNYTSFDWLLYTFLAKRFEGDSRVTFLIPNGPDALYRIYDHRYLLTHGDQFQGGDGMIGALGPIIRGDHKKRSRNSQVDQEYDTMVLGHWHQLIQLERVIVNGSLKGYDEYANSKNFGFEPPRQALWITHPQHGITFSIPINLDRARKSTVRSEWVSWKK